MDARSGVRNECMICHICKLLYSGYLKVWNECGKHRYFFGENKVPVFTVQLNNHYHMGKEFWGTIKHLSTLVIWITRRCGFTCTVELSKCSAVVWMSPRTWKGIVGKVLIVLTTRLWVSVMLWVPVILCLRKNKKDSPNTVAWVMWFPFHAASSKAQLTTHNHSLLLWFFIQTDLY